MLSVNDHCPSHLPRTPNLLQFGGFCYEMVLDHPGDWYHAKADCESRRGYLVDIHNFPEQAFLINSIQVLGIPDDKGVWIGMTDETSEGNWKWVSGVAMNFKNWAGSQPGMIGGMENCGLMEFSGTWHDYPCHGLIFTTENHGWICKYDILT